MDFNTDKYLPFLKRVLSPPRYRHSVGVMEVMGELSEIYQLDNPQALTAGLLHDAARDLTPQRLLALADDAGIQLSHPCEQHPVYLHALVSAYLISKELDVTDRLILDAISAHSYIDRGNNFDVPLAQCLRAADILAPVREWTGMKKLRSVVYAGRMEEAALLQSGWLVEYLEEQGIPVHPNLAKRFQTLSAQLNVADSFFERW
ncbi:MAG: bis(5'-nucleosyl)-tetraphosphatase (symmetrical) YqeK [Chloroflexi bacterium]|nr:bis(5'-nucleosyl)-tetraphosphatase (symmetrical) YqeK [Chloroflexota bacterium]